jgi:S1-C subfamily serine protease
MPKSRPITILQLLMPSALLCFAMGAPAQLKSENSPLEHTEQTSIPITTKWTLEAAGAVQQVEINSVVLLICPVTQTKGSGFLIDTGLIVTNNHVLNGCTAGQMQCITSQGSTISFTKAVVDKDVDLALLKPSHQMTGGLHLASADKPKVGASVSTWGYPLAFNGPAPILSTAILAGFIEDGIGAEKVKHLILNGAINPGNSGGPLFQGNDDKVIGIVVAKYLPYSSEVQRLITLLASNTQSMLTGVGSGNFVGKDAQGHEITVTPSMVTASVLQEFYNGTQVSLGEAISVEELKTLLASKASELR